jgi:hypothetical protein
VGENTQSHRKTEALLVASKDVGLGINAEKLCVCPFLINSMQEENTT